MRILSNLSVNGTLGLNSVADANTDTDKFLVIDSNGIVKYRTGQELYNDIGAGGEAAFTSVLQHEVKAGVALTKGQAVYVTSADGTNMIVGKASNASEATSSKTLGLIAQNLAINGIGFVVTEGLLAGLDTSTAGTEGDPVWLGTDGNLVYGLGAKPYAPAHLVFIGIVTRKNANNGEIFVKVQNGFELQELHNVQITSTPSDNTVLAYETATSLYKMKSIPTLLGYTPTTNARTLTINGTSYDLSADRSWSVGTHTGNLTTGYVPKATGATTLTDSLIYDNGSAIGINTSSPFESSAFKLDVNGGVIIKNTSGTAAQLILINSNPASGGNNGFVQLSAGGNTATAFGQWQTYYGTSIASGALRLQPAGGQVLIGTSTTSAFTTDINGTLRVSGQLTLGSTITNGTHTYTLPSGTGTLALVGDIPSLSGYVPTSRTLTINGTSYDLSADRSWTITAGVSSVQAGSGISVSTSGGVATVSNTGLLSGTAGSGISVSTSGQNLNIVNTGLLSGTAGSGISVSTSGQNLNIVNTGLLSATAGSGISVSTSSQNVNIVNTGLLSATAGTGISVSTSSGVLTIANTITNNNQLTNGAGYITGINSSMVTTALGYTPVTDARTITINGATYDLTANRSWTVGNVTGSGTTNYVPKFTGSSSIGNSQIFDNGTNVGIGTAMPVNLLTLKASVVAPVIDINRSGGGQGKNSGILFRDQLNNEIGAIGTEGQETNDLQILSVGGIRFYTSSNLIITNERMRIFSDGNVGINTGPTNAGFKLDVIGTARVSSLITGGGGIKISGGTPYVGGYVRDGLWGATATPNFISTTGNAGPYGGASFLLGYDDNESGLYSPAYGFPVKSTDGNNTPNRVVRALVMRDTDKNTYPFIVYNNGAVQSLSNISATTTGLSSDFNAGAFIARSSGNTGRYIQMGYDNSSNYGWLQALEEGVAYRNIILNATAGNVGVGLTGPLSKLHVNGTFQVGYVDALNTAMEFYWNGSSSYGRIQTYSSSHLALNPLGNNVGIGTANPSTKLEVRSNSPGVAAARFSDSNYADLVIGFPTAGVASIDFEYGGAGALSFRSGTGKIQRMFLTSAGQLSVSLSTGAAAFDNGINIITQAGTYTAGHGGILQFQNEDVITAGIRGVRDPGSWASSLLFYTHTSAVGNTFGTTFTEKARITDDGNLLVNTVTNSGFKLDVNGTTRVNGNLSIGTSYNGFALNVSGVAYIIGGSAWVQNGYGYVNSGATSTGLYPMSDNTIQFRINNSTAVTINASSNVGIGTGSPESRLMINGDWADMTGAITYSTNTKGIILNQDAGGGYGMGIWFRQAGLTAGIGSTRVSGGDWATDLRFYTHPSVTTNQNTLYERMRINSEGNVAIGSTNANDLRLRVVGEHPSGLAVLGVQPTSGTVSSIGLFDSGGTRKLLIYRDTGFVGIETASDPLLLNTNGTERMRITSSGQLIIKGFSTNSLSSAFIENSNSSLAIYTTEGGGTTKDLILQVGGSASANNMILKANGNMLLGTTTDSGYKLDVIGTARFTGSIRGGGNLELVNTGGPYLLVGEGVGVNEYAAIDWDATNNRLRIATQPYAFGANGGQITLTTNGNVGIGTVSPTSRLTIQGTSDSGLTITNSSGATRIILSPSGAQHGEFLLRNNDNNATVYLGGAASSNNYVNAQGGNFGINTTFSGINTASQLTIKAAVADGNQIYIVQSNDDRGWRMKAKTDGHFYLQSAYSSGNSDVLKACYDTGNVLIGTTTDNGYRLNVSGTGRFTSMIFGGGGVRIAGGNGNTSYTPDGLWGASATPNFISSTGYGGAYGNALNSESLLLGYADNGSGLYSPAYGFQVKSTDGAGVQNRVVVAIRIKDTDKNTYPLTIYNNGFIETIQRVSGLGFFAVGSLNNTEGSFLIDHPGVQSWKIGVTNSNTSTFSIGNDNGGSFATKVFNITNAGNVGINGTSSSYTFYVNGTSLFGAITVGSLGTGALYSNSGFLTNTNPSDFRLKNTIKPLTYGLNEILKLNPKTFYYNDDVAKARLKYGFIAQDVKEIMPELARKLEGSSDYLGLETEGIFVTLVNAVKELKAELDSIKNNQNNI